jgi:hypothetical protein
MIAGTSHSRRPLPLPLLSPNRLHAFEQALTLGHGGSSGLPREKARQFAECAKKNLRVCPRDKKRECNGGDTDFFFGDPLDESCVSFKSGNTTHCTNESNILDWWRSSKLTKNPFEGGTFHGEGCSRPDERASLEMYAHAIPSPIPSPTDTDDEDQSPRRSPSRGSSMSRSLASTVYADAPLAASPSGDRSRTPRLESRRHEDSSSMSRSPSSAASTVNAIGGYDLTSPSRDRSRTPRRENRRREDSSSSATSSSSGSRSSDGYSSDSSDASGVRTPLETMLRRLRGELEARRG